MVETITLPGPEHTTNRKLLCKKQQTIYPPASVRSILTGFVALDFGEKFVCQQKISTLHCHQQILFFPHDNQRQTNCSQSTAKVAFIVLSMILQANGFGEFTGSC